MLVDCCKVVVTKRSLDMPFFFKELLGHPARIIHDPHDVLQGNRFHRPVPIMLGHGAGHGGTVSRTYFLRYKGGEAMLRSNHIRPTVCVGAKKET